MSFFRRIRPFFFVSAALMTASSVAAETKIKKFATLAPEGSSWMNTMTALNKELMEKTAGQVKFKFYAGGTMGDEKDVVKKVRIGQLHAAGFTGVGLGEIAPEVRVLDAPWLFKGDKEVDFIYKAFAKPLSASIEKGGYVLLGWTELGPVYLFTKRPLKDPEDMKEQKMWVWEGDPIAQAAYAALGVSPIPLSVVDVMSSLQTGLVDGVYGPPMGVVALQWFKRTKFIYPVPMARSAGAVLISERLDQLTSSEDAVRGRRQALQRLNEQSRAENDELIAEKQGLTMTARPSPPTCAS